MEASTVGSHPDTLVSPALSRHTSRAFAALPTSMRPFWMHNTLLQARLPQPSCISHQTVTPNPTETRLCCLSAWVVAPHISLPLVRRCFPPLRLAIWALFSDEMDVMAAASPDSRRLAPLSHRHWFRRARQTGTGATVQPDEMPRQCQSRPPTSAATHQQGCSRVSGRQADARRAVSTLPPPFSSLPSSACRAAGLWPRLCLQGRPLAVSCA